MSVRPRLEAAADHRQLLHQEVDDLRISDPKADALVRALIELGRVTELRCQMPHCRFPGEGFEPGTNDEGVRSKKALSIDHIKLRAEGGSNMPWNLRLAHWSCNAAWTTGRERPLQGAQVSAAFWLRRMRDLQVQTYGRDPGELEGAELDEYVRMNFLAMYVELGEALQEIPEWKPWKAGHIEFGDDAQRDRFIEELVDASFFLANVLNALHVSGGEFVKAYAKKFSVNEARGTAGKIFKMGRAR